MPLPRRSPVTDVTTALAANRLGVPAVVFFVMSAAAPLTVVAGVVTTGYAVTGATAIPAAFVLVALILGLFSVGYVAMARRITNAGAFYAYVTRGLGRPAGVAAAWVALVAYNLMQVGLYGAVGAAATPLLDRWCGVAPPWWAVALVAWALVAVLGVLRVDVNGGLLAALLIAELVVIVVFTAAELAHPAAGYPWQPLSPHALFHPGAGALLVLATTGFVGFESAVVFSEESRDPGRTVPVATYTSVGLIAAVYALAAWAMAVATGPARIVAEARRQGPELIFNLARGDLGGPAADLGHLLFLTSVLAAMISFHGTTARYMFALGRERVLPAVLGTTSRSGAPKAGSLTQSAVGLLAIAVFAAGGWDPVVHLFFWGGTTGAFGILLLLAATALAVLCFAVRHPTAEPAWRRLVLPALAAAALLLVLDLAVENLTTLLGTGPHAPGPRLVPWAYGGIALFGAGWALVLRRVRPDVYATIGLGPHRAVAAMVPGTLSRYAGPTQPALRSGASR